MSELFKRFLRSWRWNDADASICATTHEGYTLYVWRDHGVIPKPDRRAAIDLTVAAPRMLAALAGIVNHMPKENLDADGAKALADVISVVKDLSWILEYDDGEAERSIATDYFETVYDGACNCVGCRARELTRVYQAIYTRGAAGPE